MALIWRYKLVAEKYFNAVTKLGDASFLFPSGRIFLKFTNNLSGYQDYSGDNNKLLQKVIAGGFRIWFQSRDIFFLRVLGVYSA